MTDILVGDLRGGKKYEKSRKRLTAAMETKNRPDLESAMSDFEGLLANEKVRNNEKTFLLKAHELNSYLLDIEISSMPWFDSL